MKTLQFEEFKTIAERFINETFKPAIQPHLDNIAAMENKIAEIRDNITETRTRINKLASRNTDLSEQSGQAAVNNQDVAAISIEIEDNKGVITHLEDHIKNQENQIPLNEQRIEGLKRNMGHEAQKLLANFGGVLGGEIEKIITPVVKEFPVFYEVCDQAQKITGRDLRERHSGSYPLNMSDVSIWTAECIWTYMAERQKQAEFRQRNGLKYLTADPLNSSREATKAKLSPELHDSPIV